MTASSPIRQSVRIPVSLQSFLPLGQLGIWQTAQHGNRSLSTTPTTLSQSHNLPSNEKSRRTTTFIKSGAKPTRPPGSTNFAHYSALLGRRPLAAATGKKYLPSAHSGGRIARTALGTRVLHSHPGLTCNLPRIMYIFSRESRNQREIMMRRNLSYQLGTVATKRNENRVHIHRTTNSLEHTNPIPRPQQKPCSGRLEYLSNYEQQLLSSYAGMIGARRDCTPPRRPRRKASRTVVLSTQQRKTPGKGSLLDLTVHTRKHNVYQRVSPLAISKAMLYLKDRLCIK